MSNGQEDEADFFLVSISRVDGKARGVAMNNKEKKKKPDGETSVPGGEAIGKENKALEEPKKPGKKKSDGEAPVLKKEAAGKSKEALEDPKKKGEESKEVGKNPKMLLKGNQASKEDWIIVWLVVLSIVIIALGAAFFVRGPSEEIEANQISPPGIVGQADHAEIMMALREAFPEAQMRGVEQEEFSLTTPDEIKRFVRESYSSWQTCSGSDQVNAIIGLMSSAPGWEDIPIGWAKSSDGSFFLITLIEQPSGLVACQVELEDNCLYRIVQDPGVRFVFIT